MTISRNHQHILVFVNKESILS